MALEERLASPKLESFHQRIAARCYLQPMTREETAYYVQEQIRRAGGVPEAVFTTEALKAIHTATDGIPRLVNQVCDHGLMLASLGGHKQLGPAGIEEAWADLQQLPVPWHETPAAAAESGIIEFGQLADDAAARPVAGTIGPTVGDAAFARLDEVEQHVREIDSAAGGDEFSPVVASGTEVELIFHEAHDPFGSHWDEEEVVIDRYASLEDKSLRNRQRVTSSEGQMIGALVTAALDAPPKVVPPPLPHETEPAGEPEPAIAAMATFDPASDPLLPEEPSDLPARMQTEFSQRATISLRSIAEDDRDIIVVDEDEPPPAPPPAGRPRRQEYRQLFSSLRNKT
jgi:hypothetical protein